MSDLKQIEDLLDETIHPNLGISGIKAEKHNEFLKEFIKCTGYIGFSFISYGSDFNGVINDGNMSWNNNNMNNTNPFTITISKKSKNGVNNLHKIIDSLDNNSLILFRDYHGRNAMLNYLGYRVVLDANNNEVFEIDVTGDSLNNDFVYNSDGVISVISFINKNSFRNLDGYFEEGSRDNGDIRVITGDYDDSGNGTKITVDDENKQIKLDFETLLINTLADGLSDAVKASIYQQETGGGKSANEVNTFRDFVRDAVFNASATYTNQVIRLLDTANDDSTGGTKVAEIINRKTGAGNLSWQYVFDFKNELHQGDLLQFTNLVLRNEVLGTEVANVTDVMRAISPVSKIDNPNATVEVMQCNHPNLTFKRGTVKGAQVIFLDIDVDTANLGGDLTIQGDVAYMQGGGGGDIPPLIQYLSNNGYKLRFIWNQGTVESDFNGIINYLGTVDSIEDATEKVLINKEYGDKHYGKLVDVPASATATGEEGQFAYDNSFFYVCVATNTWVRTALTTW